MLVILFSMFVYGVVEPSSTAFETAKFLTLPVFTFAGAAFGIDAVFKQKP